MLEVNAYESGLMSHNQFSQEMQREILRAVDSLGNRSLMESRFQEARASFKAQARIELANRIALEQRLEELIEQNNSLQTRVETLEADVATPELPRLPCRNVQMGRLIAAVGLLLPSIGQAPAASSMQLVEDDEAQWTLMVRGAGFGVSHGVMNEAGFAEDNQPRFRLFAIKTATGGRDQPDEEIDTSILYAPSVTTIIDSIGQFVVRETTSGLVKHLTESEVPLAQETI